MKVRERIRILQPFTAPELGGQGAVSAMKLAHRANVRDRHKAQVRWDLLLDSINLPGLSCKLVDEDAAFSGWPR